MDTNDSIAIKRLKNIFELQKTAHNKNPNPRLNERIELMKRIPDMVRKYRDKIKEGLLTDFGSHSEETTDLFEIVATFDRAQYYSSNLKNWMKPIKKAGNPVTLGHTSLYVKHSPKGVIGNMAAWNFPYEELLGPLFDMLSAGNKVIMKPSELAPASGKVIEEMISEFFKEDEVAVVNGGLELAKEFTNMPWDHLMYTGSANVGKIVMEKAAKNLTPVTLELGGKCPTIIDETAVTDENVEMIVGVKVIKRGQICTNTDYIIVHESKKDELIEKIKANFSNCLESDNGISCSTGIINDRHVNRLQSYLDDAKAKGAEVVQLGVEMDNELRNMPFYLILNPTDDLLVMQEEIFGPILPIKTYSDPEEVISYVNAHDRPLGLYIFSKNKTFIDRIANNTHSGGVGINLVALQAAQPSLPFGGVGASGMGRIHGQEGFQEFSYARGYMVKGSGGTIDWFIPPFDKKTRKLINDVAYAPMGKQIKFALSRLPKIIGGLFK